MEGFVHLLSIIIIENFFHVIFHFIYQIIHEMLHLLIPFTAMFCKTKFITEILIKWKIPSTVVQTFSPLTSFIKEME